MSADNSSWLLAAWSWLRANDLPNWLALAFTAVLWPVALFVWHRRKVQAVPGLEIHFQPGSISISQVPHAAVALRMTNHTGSVVYVSGARIRRCSRASPVPIEAARDVGDDSYHLKFINPSGEFELRETTLQTSASAQSCMPVAAALPEVFYTHRPSWFARRFRVPKYIVLEYTAMVGSSRYAVATVY